MTRKKERQDKTKQYYHRQFVHHLKSRTALIRLWLRSIPVTAEEMRLYCLNDNKLIRMPPVYEECRCAEINWVYWDQFPMSSSVTRSSPFCSHRSDLDKWVVKCDSFGHCNGPITGGPLVVQLAFALRICVKSFGSFCDPSSNPPQSFMQHKLYYVV